MRERRPFSTADHRGQRCRVKHLEECQLHHESISWTSQGPTGGFQEHWATWQVTLFKCALTQRMKSEDDLLFVLSLARELLHILPGASENKQDPGYLSHVLPRQGWGWGGGLPGCV